MRRIGCVALAIAIAVPYGCGSDGGGGSGGTGGTAGIGGTSGSSGAAGAEDGGTDAPSAHSLRLDFERNKPTNAFTAIVTALDSATPTPGLALAITSSRGSVGSVTDQGDGTYRAVITPDSAGTGEYRITASVAAWNDTSIERTALVLGSVGDRWGQPQAFAGLVNTPAWEDSLAISPDGEWIILEYLPVTIDCLLSHFNEPTHPTCAKARGPWTAPERPDMPGAERIASDGTITHGCPSLGVPTMPFPVPPASMFAFQRQPDGSFAAPVPISIAGADGCVSAFGASLLPESGGTSTLVFAYDTPTDGDPPTGTISDVFTTEITLGQPTELASFSGGQQTMNATLLGFSTAGQQGNPHIWIHAGKTWIFIDDETAPEKDLLVYELGGTYPAGPWTGPTKLPAPVNEAGADDTQPFVDATEAVWNRDLALVSSKLVGADILQSASWGPVAVELAGEGITATAGAILGVGEPTKATRAGREVLAFVYVKRAEDGTLDINAGFVEAQP